MTDTKLRSVRLPADLSDAIEKASKEEGLSFNAYIVGVLRAHLLQSSADQEWMESVRDWLLETFNERDFPADVTRRVFSHIRHTPELWAGYQNLVIGEDGRVDSARRAHVHKEVGRMVKQALNAEVIGRVVDLDPEEYLIRSHALLRPRRIEKNGLNEGDNDYE